MLRLALVMLLFAVIAAVLGFGVLSSTLASVAQIAFIVFLVLFLISAVSSAFSGRAPV